MGILAFVILIVAMLGCVDLVVKRIKEYIRIGVDAGDIDIEGRVIEVIPLLGGNRVQPIIQYTMNEKTAIYKFHSGYSQDKYLVDDRVILKLSKRSGMVYEKSDLIREIKSNIALVLMMLLGIIIFLSEIIF